MRGLIGQLCSSSSSLFVPLVSLCSSIECNSSFEVLRSPRGGAFVRVCYVLASLCHFYFVTNQFACFIVSVEM